MSRGMGRGRERGERERQRRLPTEQEAGSRRIMT